MRIGCTLPQTELGADPAAMRDFAQAAESLGYDHIVLLDHVVGAVHEGRKPALTGPYTPDDAFHEPFVTLGFLAAVTTRIQLVTGILILPQRQTVLVAKQAAQVANLSKGRLRLCIGTGWNYVEYEALGQDWKTRGRRYDEQIALLRRLWSEPVVDFAGEFHRVDRAGINPLPQYPIPLWFGGSHEPAFRRAARHAEGFILGARGEQAVQHAERIRQQVAAHGRDLSTFGLEAILDFSVGPEKWRGEAESWQARGATHGFLHTLRIGLNGVDRQIDALRRYAAEVPLQGA